MHSRTPRLRARPGQSLMEVVVALGVLVFIAAAFARLSLGSYSGERQAREQTTGAAYAAQGLEATRSIAEANFDNLTTGNHGLDDRTGVYAFSGSTNVSGKFTRVVNVAAVNRNGSGAIVNSGGSDDPDTRAVRSTVTWNVDASHPNTVSFFTYLTHWQLGRWVTSLLADFQAGYRNSTTLTQTGDGEAQLLSAGDLSLAQVSFTQDMPGTADVTKVAIDRNTDRLYMTTQNYAAGAEFFSYDISNVSTGVLTLSGSVDLGDASNGFALGTSFAYTLTNDNAQEIRVVRLSDMQIVATWNVPSNADPTDIAIDESTNRAYVVTGNGGSQEFYVLDISNPLAGTIQIVNQADIGNQVNAVAIRGNYAYLATGGNTNELVIVNLGSMAQSQCDIPGTADAVKVAISGTRLFVGRLGSTDPEFTEYAIDPNNPSDCAYILAHVTGSAQFSTDDVLGMSVNVAEGYAFLTVSDATNGLRVVKLSDYSVTSVALTGMCDAVTFLGAHVYAGCRDDTATLQVLSGASSSQELVCTDGLQNSWTLTDNGGNASNATNTFLVRTGANSLLTNPAAGGSTQFNKSYTNSADGSLDFYVNTVSPWAFALYGGNAGTAGGNVTLTNATYGAVYQTNAEEGAFTDFPTLDYATLQTLAQSTSSYINTGADVTLTAANLTSYNGKVVFVEMANNKTLTVDFGNAAGSYTVSIVEHGGNKNVVIKNYNGSTLSAINGTTPVLAAQRPLVLSTNANLTLNGMIFSENKLDSSAINGSNRVTINGSVVASTVNSTLDRAIITYTTDFNATPPTYFTPTYSDQNFTVQANIGSSVATNSYVSGGSIDKDPTTWQLVSIPLSALGIGGSAITYVRLGSASNQPSVFLDDVRFVRTGGAITLSRWGTFTTAPFDSASASTQWKKVRWSRGNGTGSLTLRLRTANSLANLKQALWVGSDGTATSLYTQSGGQVITVDPGTTGTQYMQWKGYLSGSGGNTPILNDVTLTFQ